MRFGDGVGFVDCRVQKGELRNGLPRGAFHGDYLVVLGGTCSQDLEPRDWAVQLGSQSLTS